MDMGIPSKNMGILTLCVWTLLASASIQAKTRLLRQLPGQLPRQLPNQLPQQLPSQLLRRQLPSQPNTDGGDELTPKQEWATQVIEQILSWLSEMAGTAPAKLGVPKSKCARGWSSFQDSCYLLVGWYNVTGQGEPEGADCETWYDAEEKCNEMKNTLGLVNTPHLVSIQSEEENRFVQSLDTHDLGFWIGLSNATYLLGQHEWTWSDGSEVTYTNWGEGQPNVWNNGFWDGLWNEVVMNIGGEGSVGPGKWRTLIGTELGYPYVCEYKP